MSNQIFLLVDAHAIIYRAYYAFPELSTSRGELINAVFGFTRILLSSISQFEPRFLAVAFDHPTPTFRHEKYDQYKANREEMPLDLRPQIDRVKQVVDALNIPRFEVEGYEADDVIGSLSRQACSLEDEEKVEVLIVTGDKDILQLVTECVHVYIAGRGKNSDTEYDLQTVLRKMGVTSGQIIDLKALMGDASDNIPGIRGIGPKTASNLLRKFDNLDRLYQTIDALGENPTSADLAEVGIGKSIFSKLFNGKQNAYLSRDLAAIDVNTPISLDINSCRVSGYDKSQVVELFEELGFQSLVKKLPSDDFELGVQGALF